MERWMFVTWCQMYTLYPALSGSFFGGKRRDGRVTEQKSGFVSHIYELNINLVFPRYRESV